jgi:hypothetical protein
MNANHTCSGIIVPEVAVAVDVGWTAGVAGPRAGVGLGAVGVMVDVDPQPTRSGTRRSNERDAIAVRFIEIAPVRDGSHSYRATRGMRYEGSGALAA